MWFPKAATITSYIIAVLGNSLPTVDLGYEIYQANDFNVCSINSPSEMMLTAVDNGSVLQLLRHSLCRTTNRIITVDSAPAAFAKSINCPYRWNGELLPSSICSLLSLRMAILSGQIQNTSQCDASLIPQPSPLEREDCLFLDVVVPKAIFDNREWQKAPVVVQVYGGGFAFGRKWGDENPAGLLETSRQLDPEGRGVIYVNLSYRVGAVHTRSSR